MPVCQTKNLLRMTLLWLLLLLLLMTTCTTPTSKVTPSMTMTTTTVTTTTTTTATTPTSTITPTPSPAVQPAWSTLDTAGIPADRTLQAIAVAPNGDLWLGTDLGVYHFDGQTWESHTDLGRGVSVRVLSLAVGPAGGVWAGTREGVARFDGRVWTPYRRSAYCERAYCPEPTRISAIGIAPDGALWFAYLWNLYRFDGQTWTEYEPYPYEAEEEGSTPASIEALAILPNGNIWFGTLEGAYRLDDQAVTLTGAPTGWRRYTDGAYHPIDPPTLVPLGSDRVNRAVEAIAAAPDGDLWFGTTEGAFRFDGQSWEHFTAADGLAGDWVKSIAAAPDGALWFVTDDDVSRYGPKAPVLAQVPPSPAATPIPTRSPTPTRTPTNTPIPPTPSPTPTPLPAVFRPVAAVEDILPGESEHLYVAPDGGLWLFTDQGAARFSQDGTRPVVSTTDVGTPVGVDAAGRIWAIGENHATISAWVGSAWTSYGAEAGWTPLYEDEAETWYRYVGWGQSDAAGRFWLPTSADVRFFDGARWTVFTPAEMGMEEEEEEEEEENDNAARDLIVDLALTTAEHADQVWVGACLWSGPGPFGGWGARWFDGQTWRGAESPVASGCVNRIIEDGSGRVWLGADGTVWRYDPPSKAWVKFTPPEEPPFGFRRFGSITGLAQAPAGDVWATFLLCGGASCDTEALYRLRDGAWTLIPEHPLMARPALAFDPAGIPWLFGEAVYRILENDLEMVGQLQAQSLAIDPAGQVWFTAWHRGQNRLWTLDW